MKKKISYVVCDVCNQEIDTDNGHTIHKCDICERDLCSDCFSQLSGTSIKFKVCLKCVSKADAKKELRKFLNRKDIKEQLKNVEDKLKENFTNIAKPRRNTSKIRAS